MELFTCIEPISNEEILKIAEATISKHGNNYSTPVTRLTHDWDVSCTDTVFRICEVKHLKKKLHLMFTRPLQYLKKKIGIKTPF